MGPPIALGGMSPLRRAITCGQIHIWGLSILGIWVTFLGLSQAGGFPHLEDPDLQLVPRTPSRAREELCHCGQPKVHKNPPFFRDLKTHPKSQNAQKKTRRLRELFRKVRANFCLLPCEISQEPSRNCSEKLIQLNFLTWVDFGGWSLLL